MLKNRQIATFLSSSKSNLDKNGTSRKTENKTVKRPQNAREQT